MNDQAAITHVDDLRYVNRSLWAVAEKLALSGRLTEPACRIVVPPRSTGLLSNPATAKRRELLASGLRLPWKISGLLPALTRGPARVLSPLEPPISTPASSDDEVTNVMAFLLSTMKQCQTDRLVSMRYGVTQAEAHAVRCAGVGVIFDAASQITLILPNPIVASLRLAATNWPEPSSADGTLSDLAALAAAHA